MNRVKVTCEIDTYDEPRKPAVRIDAHWNDDSMVVIKFDGKSFTVVGRDLITAIENCQRTG